MYAGLLQAARFLTTATPADLLAAVLGNRARLDRLLPLVAGIDHMGLTAAPQAEAGVRTAAIAAGFSLRQWSFPSQIVARELGELNGRSRVPTTVFRAQGASPRGGVMNVEVFVPQSTSRATLAWIRQGIGNHVAFAVEDRSLYPEITHLMEAEGFRSPGFMGTSPLVNEAERMSALYFDSRYPAGRPRLEFCCYE